MALWSSSESGILRKRKKDNDVEKLLVFGYACKLFKDDEKALHIDQGKHLIPWMGNENLKIDRYDCRGHLSDLKRYEASCEDYDTARWLDMDENERKLEQLCDEERYYSLHNNEEDEEMYKEEELKRNKTNEFQYSYDVPTDPNATEKVPTVPENDIDEKYVPSPDLDVPVDIEIPKTVKEYARIEKTAIFVSTQGPQMEILIKAKQSDNPQFSFLNQNDPLYKFYRHVLDAVRNRRYRSLSPKSDTVIPNTSIDDNNDHYLHPSLVSSVAPSTEVQQPTLPYRPNANCAYSQLVCKIQGSTNLEGNIQSTTQAESPAVNPEPTGSGQLDPTTLTYEQQQQYYQYYVQRQYYEYYKQLMEKSGTSNEFYSQGEVSMDPNMQGVLQQMMYAQYLQQVQVQQSQSTTNPYAQIVSNLCEEVTNSNLQSSNGKTDISRDPIVYSNGEVPDQNRPMNAGDTPSSKATILSESPKKAALSLLQNYASDSDEDIEEENKVEDDFKVPDEDTKLVIDKMACYVVKNGEDFERIVKSRDDPRFEFLKKDHEYFSYYRYKVEEELKKIKESERGADEKIITAEPSKGTPGKIKEKKVIAPVSFSIKKAREDPPKEIKSALPVDEETDEEEMANQEAVPTPPVVPQPPSLVTSSISKKINRVETQVTNKEKETQPILTTINNQDETETKTVEYVEKVPLITDKTQEESKKEDGEKDVKTKINDLLVEDDPILEMIDLTEDERRIDLVKNADIFDLTPVKQTTAKENRALQLERRRKAMAFLKSKIGTQESEPVPDSEKPVILTIDLSNVSSPKKKHLSESSEDEERRKPRKRSRSRTCDIEHHRSKSVRSIDKTASRKGKDKYKKIKTSKLHRLGNGEISDKEEGEMSDDSEDAKYKKSSHKKKKSSKRKHSKSKYKSKKKSKRRETRASSSSQSDSEYSSHS